MRIWYIKDCQVWFKVSITALCLTVMGLGRTRPEYDSKVNWKVRHIFQNRSAEDLIYVLNTSHAITYIDCKKPVWFSQKMSWCLFFWHLCTFIDIISCIYWWHLKRVQWIWWIGFVMIFHSVILSCVFISLWTSYR